MHELAITESILEISLRHAQAQNATKITDLYIVMGQWSSVVDDSVQFYWDMISDGTIAQGANLHFERIRTELTCLDCGKVYQPDAETLPCPNCQSTRLKVTKGEEFRLDSIEIEN
ncbi:MAG: hydrogenase maturation nickel metallochaperone HypA [Anaerolineae bacterium]|nr:hydrogenase maturation nickel metallochaperone HypA [Anaerolineae bacterium]